MFGINFSASLGGVTIERVMFTGIVETVGIISHIHLASDCVYFSIHTPALAHDFVIGESISVNGACLTVTDCSEEYFKATVVPETLRLTNLGSLQPGDQVNIERSLLASSRMGGHYVQGHVDSLGEVLDIQADGDIAWLMKVGISAQLTKYIVKKGYIALDGMSLTIIDVGDSWFTVTLIPHTQQVTIANQYRQGKKINIEVDILSKYVEKLLGGHICSPMSNASNLL